MSKMVLTGMLGGVDSAACVLRLKEQGCDISTTAAAAAIDRAV